MSETKWTTEGISPRNQWSGRAPPRVRDSLKLTASKSPPKIGRIREKEMNHLNQHDNPIEP